ncbi:OmpA family protein [Candidatus Binatia bacterium]|nr:OmpA family protein [Candidatus Binatia bacterium]
MSKGGETVKVIIKKKKGGHAAHHGGAWKVAYADFVTAMMALFMVLWLLTQADVKLRSQIAQYFRDPGVLPGGSILSQDQNPSRTREPAVVEKDIMLLNTGELKRKQERRAEEAAQEQKNLEKQAQAVTKAIQKLAGSDEAIKKLQDQVIVEVSDAGLSIQVLDQAGDRQLLFDLSSAELKPPLVKLLQRIAAVLGEMPNGIQVGGHTDARPYAPGSIKTNWELSFERADNARRVLESNGLRTKQVSRVLAYADSQPLKPEDPMADENRRLSILAERQRPTGAVVTEAAAEPSRPAPVVLPADAIPERTAALDPHLTNPAESRREAH